MAEPSGAARPVVEGWLASNNVKAQIVSDLTTGVRRKQRKTAVEQLDAQYPGLQAFVDKLLNAFVPVKEIAPNVLRAFGVRIPERTLGSYRHRRWVVARQRKQDEIQLKKVIEELKKKYGEEQISRLEPHLRYLWALKRMDPLEFLRELRFRSQRDLADKMKSELDLKSKA